MARDPMTDDDYRTLARFRLALRTFTRFSEDAARAAGVTPHQHQLLLAVRGLSDRSPTISEVAEWLHLRHHSTVELVDRAAEAGLVERSPDEHDHRRQRILLTATGNRVLASLSELHLDEVRRFREEMAEVLGDLG